MKDSDIDKQLADLKKDIRTKQGRIVRLHHTIGKYTGKMTAAGIRKWENKITALEADILKLRSRISRLEQSKEFNAHLRHTSKIVEGWPKWKQNLVRKQSPELCEPLDKVLAEKKKDSDLVTLNTSHELWRKYVWTCPTSDMACEVTITEPASVSFHAPSN